MQTKYGNFQGRKPSKTKQLQLFIKQIQPKDGFILPKFIKALAAIPKEIASDQDKVMLAGVQTEDVSVQLFEAAVYRRAK
ncbi:hypothetical protein [Nostoc sp.]|uniref:hypothetical protein n=1 Tax=Nostoc sp. TaxID=1180 RepID=UPI002FFBFD34